MSIVDGQRVRALESNAAWASKQANNTYLGVQTLSNPGSGGSILNAQLTLNNILADLVLKISIAEKGQPLGVATLDSNAKLDISQIPTQLVGAVVYQGVWDASLNSPALSDATGEKGQYYVVSVSGTQDLGSGNITFDQSDWVIHNGTIWERLDAANVTTVNGQTGVVIVPVPKVEYRTLTLSEISNAEIVLAETPLAPLEVALDVKGGVTQFYSDDFTVSGNILSWSGLGLDGVLVEGDKVRVIYTK